jgi:hypothetical protein
MTSGFSTLGNSVEPQRDNHHVSLDDEIESLNICIAELDDLIGRVQHGPMGKELGPCAPRPVRSLADVLSGGTERVRSARLLIQERIKTVEALLF